MKNTLLFCTSYVDSNDCAQNRYKKWIEYHTSHHFFKDFPTVLIDDGSEMQYLHDLDCNVVTEGNELPESTPLLYHFNSHQGRCKTPRPYSVHQHFRGWWRSFLESSRIARELECNKMIHIESDSYVLSNRLCDYIDNVNSGWVSMWCPRYGLPETCIQIINEDRFDAVDSLRDLGYSSFNGVVAEKRLPFSHVERGFKGDRYGEYNPHIDISTVDYYCAYPVDKQLK